MHNIPKLKYEDIIIMRALRLHDKKKYNKHVLGAIFNMTGSGAYKAFSGITWKNIYFPIQPYAGIIARKFIDQPLT